MKIDLSSFTGEAEPVQRHLETTETEVLRSDNMVFGGCGVTQGSGKGVVVATGNSTQLGLQKK